MEHCPPSPYIALSPRDARQFVRRTLDELGRSDLCDDAELLVSEVVTNAVLHGGGTYAPVSVLRTDDGIRVEVTDPGGEFVPHPELLDVTTPGGLGLGIVDRVAARWGIVPITPGKVVWFELSA